MGTIAKIAGVVLAISFMTFVAFFGRLPALRRTPIAWLYRVIWVHIPNAILAADRRLTSGLLTSSLGRFGTYMMYGRHPTVLIFFFLLLSVGEYLYLPGAWPRLSIINKTFGIITIIAPYAFLYLSAYSDPGVIAPTTHSRYMSLYPYDFTCFHPGAVCRTCNFIKPARSKHCAVCNRCVARLDHHCVFINNCVGYGNQHYFLLLLLSTAILTLYGGVLGMQLVRESVQGVYPQWSLFKPRSEPWHVWIIGFTMGLQADVGLGSVTMLALMTSPMVWGLLIYQLYLIYCGTTTNESLKWSDWKAEMEDGFAYKRSIPSDRTKNPKTEPVWTRWPVEAIQVVIRTEDGSPPTTTGTQSLPGTGDWERVWNLNDVENLYDLGFKDNLLDVFVPWYSFRDVASNNDGWLENGAERGRRRKAANLSNSRS